VLDIVEFYEGGDVLTSKPVAPKKRVTSVTPTLSAPPPAEKRYAPTGPRSEDDRLTLWLAVGNGRATSPLEFPEITFILPPQSLESLQQSVEATLDRIVRLAERLRMDFSRLTRLRNTGVPHADIVSLAWGGDGIDLGGDLALGLDGRLTDATGNLRKMFIEALRGTELWRFNRCQICNQFFYAARSDRKACSKLCNTALRVRRWRKKQSDYELNRKLREPRCEAAPVRRKEPKP
jgi:hypothetical protein